MELITVSIPQTDGYYSRSGGKRFPSLLGVFPVTPTVVTNSVENGFNDAFPGNSSTQNELKSKKIPSVSGGNLLQLEVPASSSSGISFPVLLGRVPHYMSTLQSM